MIARHPIYGQNADFHRCMQFSKTEMAVRVVRSRHFDTFLQDLKAGGCGGVHRRTRPTCWQRRPPRSSWASTSWRSPTRSSRCRWCRARTVDMLVPAESEFVLEGTVYLDRRHAEGPFVDLTETYDVVRQEPVFVVKAITHRQDAIWHALLPGALEHKLLMGMPREPTIFKKVNEVVRCLDVQRQPRRLLLAARHRADRQAARRRWAERPSEAAFAGHRSCKHVFVVDQDIDIYDPLEVEWAMATRFQGDRDLVVLKNARPAPAWTPAPSPAPT